MCKTTQQKYEKKKNKIAQLSDGVFSVFNLFHKYLSGHEIVHTSTQTKEG